MTIHHAVELHRCSGTQSHRVMRIDDQTNRAEQIVTLKGPNYHDLDQDEFTLGLVLCLFLDGKLAELEELARKYHSR